MNNWSLIPRTYHLLIVSIVSLLYFPCGTMAQGSDMAEVQSTILLSPEGKALDLTEVLRQYVRIPSESGKEKKAGSYLKELCLANGLYVTDFGTEDGNFNFMASVYPPDEKLPNLILLNHIDVVPEDPEALMGPYSGEIKDGELYGRGAFDNKGPAIMQLFALVKFKNSRGGRAKHYNASLLSVSCEESQSDGGIVSFLEAEKELINAAAVIGEGPTEITKVIDQPFKKPIFGISLAHKRVLWLELKLDQNVSGHGSVTPLSYANKELVRSLERLTAKKLKMHYNELNLSFVKGLGRNKSGMSGFALRHPRLFKPVLASKLRSEPELFSVFSNTITLTDIKTNSQAVNQISTQAKAYLDCRLLPETDQDEFISMIRETLDNDRIEISVLSTYPTNLPSPSEVVYHEALESAIKEVYPDVDVIDMLMPNVNDLGYFRALNVPAYGCIPIEISTDIARNIHGKDERIPVGGLEDGMQVYFRFLEILDAKAP